MHLPGPPTMADLFSAVYPRRHVSIPTYGLRDFVRFVRRGTNACIAYPRTALAKDDSRCDPRAAALRRRDGDHDPRSLRWARVHVERRRSIPECQCHKISVVCRALAAIAERQRREA